MDIQFIKRHATVLHFFIFLQNDEHPMKERRTVQTEVSVKKTNVEISKANQNNLEAKKKT